MWRLLVPQFTYLREHSDAVAGMLAYARIDLNLSAADLTDAPSGILVSDNHFAVPGVQPAIAAPSRRPTMLSPCSATASGKRASTLILQLPAARW